MSRFTKATKHQARLRLALVGPAGSGKTYSGLAIGSHMPGPLAVIDTERGSASKYADLFAFDVLELQTFSPDQYIEALREAVEAGYHTILIDGLSHAWMGKDGALEQVDRAAKKAQGNSFAGWRDVTPKHNALVDAMLQCSAHLIVTMRAKTEYVLEEDSRGKKVPRKIGMAPVQRDGLEYEFDVTADLNLDNELIVGKTRCPAIAGKLYPKPGRDFAQELRAWLEAGDAPPAVAPPPPVPPAAPNISPEILARLDDYRGQIAKCLDGGSIVELMAIKASIKTAGFAPAIEKLLVPPFNAAIATLKAREPAAGASS